MHIKGDGHMFGTARGSSHVGHDGTIDSRVDRGGPNNISAPSPTDQTIGPPSLPQLTELAANLSLDKIRGTDAFELARVSPKFINASAALAIRVHEGSIQLESPSPSNCANHLPLSVPLSNIGDELSQQIGKWTTLAQVDREKLDEVITNMRQIGLPVIGVFKSETGLLADATYIWLVGPEYGTPLFKYCVPLPVTDTGPRR